MSLLKTAGGLVLTCLAIGTASAGPIGKEFGPNLVTNGGFENTSIIAGSGWTPTAFIAEGFDYLIDTTASDAFRGSNSFAGGGIGAPGFISQTIATHAGSNYNIHLWIANFSGFADGTAIQVLWDGKVVYSETDILASGYREIVIDPMATGVFTTLSIGLQDDSFFLNIDNISVRVVPEPATFALVLGALGAAAATRRRRRS